VQRELSALALDGHALFHENAREILLESVHGVRFGPLLRDEIRRFPVEFHGHVIALHHLERPAVQVLIGVLEQVARDRDQFIHHTVEKRLLFRRDRCQDRVDFGFGELVPVHQRRPVVLVAGMQCDHQMLFAREHPGKPRHFNPVPCPPAHFLFQGSPDLFPFLRDALQQAPLFIFSLFHGQEQFLIAGAHVLEAVEGAD